MNEDKLISLRDAALRELLDAEAAEEARDAMAPDRTRCHCENNGDLCSFCQAQEEAGLVGDSRIPWTSVPGYPAERIYTDPQIIEAFLRRFSGLYTINVYRGNLLLHVARHQCKSMDEAHFWARGYYAWDNITKVEIVHDGETLIEPDFLKSMRGL